MTSKGTLLVAVAGVIGLGCSSADDEPATMKPSPGGIPPAYAMPTTQTPAQTINPLQTNNMPNPEVMPMPVVQMPPPAAMGAGGAGAMPAPGSMIPVGPPGTGFLLAPTAGWVAGGTNEAGIQGSFFTLSDAVRTDGMPPGSTTVMPADFSMATGPTSICLSGTASQIMTNAATTMPDYSRYWGGGIGFNLADLGGTGGVKPWPRGRVVGFSFTITGTGIPPMGQFRFGVNYFDGATINPNYCVNITTGANTIRFNQIVDQCYNPTPGAPLAATAQIESLKWQVATVVTGPTPFNFCVTNLTAIVQ
ncbi:MAG: hypothetical protein ABI895_01460 [Deltaproteobacteria bacterium]